jgi:hypothetical protein
MPKGPKECPVIPPGKLIVDISVGGIEDRAALPFFSDVPPAPCILARLFSATGPLARIARLTHRAERRAILGRMGSVDWAQRPRILYLSLVCSIRSRHATCYTG